MAVLFSLLAAGRGDGIVAPALALDGASDPSQRALGNLALFSRCYAHLTSRRLPRNHPLRAQVLAGRNPIDACMEIFDYATLLNTTSVSTDGTLRYGSDAAKLPEAKLVLHTFNDLHRTWFPNDDISNTVPEGSEFYYRSNELQDESEAALHVTRALFGEGVRYREVVTSPSGMEAIRSSGPIKDTAASNRLSTYDSALDATDGAGRGHVPLDAWLVQTGELLGIRRMNLNSAKWNQVARTQQITLGTDTNRSTNNAPIYINRSLGGGLIGTPSYFILNNGRPDFLRPDGGFRQHRRWAKSVLTEVMCRELPALRTSDVVPYVQQTVTADTPAFRRSRNCMGCHATMDPMAGVVRNASMLPIPERWGGGVAAMQMVIWPTDLPREAGQVDLDQAFYRRPTNGKLFYRSHDGTLVRRDVASVAELGAAIAETEDLYVCAASRYFQYFTGVQVNLQDTGDPSREPLSAADLAYREQVVALGKALKADPSQSLRTLVRSILESDLYRTKAMRSFGPVGSAGDP